MNFVNLKNENRYLNHGGLNIYCISEFAIMKVIKLVIKPKTTNPTITTIIIV